MQAFAGGERAAVGERLDGGAAGPGPLGRWAMFLARTARSRAEDGGGADESAEARADE